MKLISAIIYSSLLHLLLFQDAKPQPPIIIDPGAIEEDMFAGEIEEFIIILPNLSDQYDRLWTENKASPQDERNAEPDEVGYEYRFYLTHCGNNDNWLSIENWGLAEQLDATDDWNSDVLWSWVLMSSGTVKPTDQSESVPTAGSHLTRNMRVLMPSSHRRQEDIGEEAEMSYNFDLKGDYYLEGRAYYEDAEHSVHWQITVNSVLWWWEPHEREFEIPINWEVEFSVIPFKAESDSLAYLWIVNGVEEDIEDGIMYAFYDAGEHSVVAIVHDVVEADTVVWTLTAFDRGRLCC